MIASRFVQTLLDHTHVAVEVDLYYLIMATPAMVQWVEYTEPKHHMLNLFNTVTSNCPSGNGCADICALINGISTCFCHLGYKLNADMRTCSGMGYQIFHQSMC